MAMFGWLVILLVVGVLAWWAFRPRDLAAALATTMARHPTPAPPTPLDPATRAATLAAAGADVAALDAALRAAGLDPAPLGPVNLPHPEARAFALQVGEARRAIEIWRALRAAAPATGLWPLYLTDPGSLEELISLQDDVEPLAALVAQAEALDPATWLADREAAEPDYFPRDPAPWPLVAPSLGEPYVLTRGAPLTLALVAVQADWHLPLALLFGDWNDCPSPIAQAALWRRWAAAWGAAPLAAGWDTVDLLVDRPPQTREQAAALAHELFVYCGDLVDQGMDTVENLAAGLVDARAWPLWWD